MLRARLRALIIRITITISAALRLMNLHLFARRPERRLYYRWPSGLARGRRNRLLSSERQVVMLAIIATTDSRLTRSELEPPLVLVLLLVIHPDAVAPVLVTPVAAPWETNTGAAVRHSKRHSVSHDGRVALVLGQRRPSDRVHAAILAAARGVFALNAHSTQRRHVTVVRPRRRRAIGRRLRRLLRQVRRAAARTRSDGTRVAERV